MSYDQSLIKVNTGQLAAGAQAMQVTVSRIAGLMSELDSGVRNLRDTWTAEGSTAGQNYDVARNKLAEHIEALRLTVAKLASVTDQAGADQAALEGRNAAMFG